MQNVPVLLPSQDRSVSWYSEEPLAFWFVPIASDPVIEHLRKEPGSVLFASSPRVLVYIEKISLSLLSSGAKSCISLSLSSWVRCSSALIILCRTLSSVSISCAGMPRTGHGTPGMALPVLSREEESPLSWPAVNVRPLLSVSRETHPPFLGQVAYSKHPL